MDCFECNNNPVIKKKCFKCYVNNNTCNLCNNFKPSNYLVCNNCYNDYKNSYNCLCLDLKGYGFLVCYNCNITWKKIKNKN